MRSYLEFLERAGHHTLFDLSDFDDDAYSPVIDYSLSCTPQDVDRLCTAEVVHGVDLSQINNFLHKKWLGIATLGQTNDKLSACLAEISSLWLLSSTIESRFHIKFGAPKVQALCGNEVILTFDVEKIAFFHTENFDRCGLFSFGIKQCANNSSVRSLRSTLTGVSPLSLTSSRRRRRKVALPVSNWTSRVSFVCPIF